MHVKFAHKFGRFTPHPFHDEQRDNPKKPWEAEDQYIEEGELLYFNFAPVVKGGSEMSSNKYYVFKDYISSIDFLDRKNGLPNPRKSNVSQYSDLFDIEDEDMKKFLFDQRGDKVVEGNVIELDGIRIGIEVCLDHRMGVLWEKLQQDDGELVDVHLITSAGMAIERGPSPLRANGVVYLTDGGGSSAACQRTDYGSYDPLVVCREGPIGLKHIPNLHSNQYNSFFSPENWYVPSYLPPKSAQLYRTISHPVMTPSFIPSDMDAWKELVSGYYTNYREQGCEFTLDMHGIDVYKEGEFYPPSVEVYPTVALP